MARDPARLDEPAPVLTPAGVVVVYTATGERQLMAAAAPDVP